MRGDKSTVVLVIVMVAGLLSAMFAASVGEAEAAQRQCYPIIAEAVEHDGKLFVEVDTPRSNQKVSIRHGGKAVPCDKIGKRVWMCKLAKGKRYVISCGKHSIECKFL